MVNVGSRASHRRRPPLWRRMVLPVVIVGSLATVAATYPRGDDLVLPPGQGVYENFDLAPLAGVPTGR